MQRGSMSFHFFIMKYNITEVKEEILLELKSSIHIFVAHFENWKKILAYFEIECKTPRHQILNRLKDPRIPKF